MGGYIKTSSVNDGIRRFLKYLGMGRSDVVQYSGHSAKSTLSSWAANAGVKFEIRRLFVGHAKTRAIGPTRIQPRRHGGIVDWVA